MSTNLDLLNQTKTNILNTITTITTNPKPTYSIDGTSISWESYMNMLVSQLNTINDLILQEQPFVYVTRGVS